MYNTIYIDVKYALIKSFLIEVEQNLLDISYNLEDSKLNIQVVLLENTILNNTVKEKVLQSLEIYQVEITEIYLSRKNFNENKGDWQPKYYKWLSTVLFSKAEIL